MQTWALIADSFREVIDRKIFWIMIVISAAIAASMACIGVDEKGIDVLFGSWHIDSEDWAVGSPSLRANVAAVTTKLIVDQYMGWAGMILALIATAGLFPKLLQTGAVDLVVSKPIARTHVFLAKYIGAMSFIAVQAAVFVVLTFLVIGVRWRCWLWGYLWMIPLTVLLFSYLYCFCALFGVLTRSTVTSILLTLVAWIAVWAPQELHAALTGGAIKLESAAQWERLVATTRWSVPKTQDIPIIAGELTGAGLIVDAFSSAAQPESVGDARSLTMARSIEERQTNSVNLWSSIGSSLISEAVIVLTAMWVFARKDF